MNTQSHKPPQKILIVAPSWVGDAVMAQSLFMLLKQHNPQIEIHVLALPWTLSLFERMPEVDAMIEMPFDHGQLCLKKRYQFAQTLKKQAFDQSIVLPNSIKSALIPWFAGIPLRTGWRGEQRYILLNDLRHLNKDQYPLMVQRFAALALSKRDSLSSEYPRPCFSITRAQQQAVIQQFSLDMQKPVIAMAPGAAFGSAKRWPLEYYTELASMVMQKGGAVWLFGSEKDAEVTRKIRDRIGSDCRDFAGQLELYQTIDMLSLVQGMVSNDSGLLHVAAALSKPMAAIYGPTSPKFTPPLSEKATILQLDLDCQPCFKRECPLGHHKCMKDLLPEQVMQVVISWGVV